MQPEHHVFDGARERLVVGKGLRDRLAADAYLAFWRTGDHVEPDVDACVAGIECGLNRLEPAANGLAEVLRRSA
jgi:hypothetical protein